MFEVREIPGAVSLAQLVAALNDRFRDLNQNLKTLVENPSRADVSLGVNRIVALGDPKDDLDGVNLRTLRRFVGAGIATEGRGAAAAETPQPQAYTIVFTKDGLVGNEETSPWFTVNRLRTGTPVVASLTASIAPTIHPLEVQFHVFPANGAEYDLLDEPLTLTPGATGPVYATAFFSTREFDEGARVEMRIITGSAAEKVVGEIVVERRAA